MATFRCKATGNTVTFTLPHDIESMEGHDAYEEVFEDEEVEDEEEVVKTPVKRKGRPPKGSE
jgi:hypothetical protein